MIGRSVEGGRQRLKMCARLSSHRPVYECICLSVTVCTQTRGWEEQRGGGEGESERGREGS